MAAINLAEKLSTFSAPPPPAWAGRRASWACQYSEQRRPGQSATRPTQHKRESLRICVGSHYPSSPCISRASPDRLPDAQHVALAVPKPSCLLAYTTLRRVVARDRRDAVDGPEAG